MGDKNKQLGKAALAGIGGGSFWQQTSSYGGGTYRQVGAAWSGVQNWMPRCPILRLPGVGFGFNLGFRF